MSRLLYKKPAKKWTEALPLGNGKLAAMVYGGIGKEQISLNDATLWSGYPRDYANPNSSDALKTARELIFQERYFEADQYVAKNMHGEYSESYMPLCDLVIRTKECKKSNYTRILDMDDAVLTVTNGKNERQAFCSYPAGALYYRINFEKPSSMILSATSQLQSALTVEQGTLCLSGRAPDHVDPNYHNTSKNPVRYDEGKGMAFAMLCKVVTDGVTTAAKDSLIIKNAASVSLIVMTETGFLGFDKMPVTDPTECICRLKERMKDAECGFEAAKDIHSKDYQHLFNRHRLDLFVKEKDAKTLLKAAKKGKADKSLVSLLYDYGKYLTIAGSRNSQPLNLQGQWNHDLRPPWSSNLTTNINYQMNYWGASACNLGECVAPFYNALDEIVLSGKRTAAVHFGARGFSCNHNVDIWRMTTPVQGDPSYMYAPLCGVWIANEAYQHSITESGYPNSIVKEAITESCLFLLDYLTECRGKLVTCPSASPEASFYHNGKRCALGYASAFETGLTLQCFQNFLSFSEDPDLRDKVMKAKNMLYGFQKTSTGINEWQDEKAITEEGHRHFSPLYAFYPGKVIGYYGGEEKVEWVKDLFDYRRNHSHHNIGWSAAWSICLAARLHDDERTNRYVKEMLQKSILFNLFDYHPPAYFQIDGNFGFVAAVNEMLFYEEDGIIDLLPACPKEWEKGKVSGHKMLGAAIDIEWSDGKVTKIVADKPVTVNRINISESAITHNVVFTAREAHKC